MRNRPIIEIIEPNLIISINRVFDYFGNLINRDYDFKLIVIERL